MRSQVAPPRLLRGHHGSMMFVAFPSGDHVISASSDKTIRRFSVQDGCNQVLKEGVLCAVAVSPNGHWVAVGGRDGKVRLLDLKTTPPSVLKSDEGHVDAVESLSFSPNSSQLASGSRDGTMLVWSLETLKPVAEPFRGYKDTVCYSDLGTRYPDWEQAWSLAWSPEGDILYAGCIDGSIKRYNPHTGMLYTSCKEHTDVVFSIVVSYNTNFIATASWDRTVRFFEAVTLQQIGPALKHETQVHSISISPDDSYLVSGSRDPNVRIWNLRDIAPTLFRSLPLDPVRGQTTMVAAHHRPTVVKNADSDHDFDGPRPSDVESVENGDRKSTKDQKFKRPRIILRNPFKPGRKQSDVSDRIPTPSGSSQTDSPRTPGTDILSLSSVSSHHLVEDPATISPAIPSAHPLSPAPISMSESENWAFIREIRSDPTHDLSGKIIPEGAHPVTGGSHGDIYRGTLHVNGRAMRVAIKAIKQYLIQNDIRSKQRRLRREIRLWLRLDHRNVLPLLGTTMGYGDFPAMVCPWVENGQLTAYLKSNYDKLTAQQKWGLINDVALGLQYLHSQSIVHGDISGANILVHNSGRACISDFGLSFVTTNLDESSLALTYQVKGTLCWTAPELLFEMECSEHDDGKGDEEKYKVFPTTQSDIYSLGGIMLQVLSGKRPYHHLSRDQGVIMAISKGEFPKRPASTEVVTDDQWAFMTQCWCFVATDRPSDTDVVMFVHEQFRESTLQRTQSRSDTGGSGG